MAGAVLERCPHGISEVVAIQCRSESLSKTHPIIYTVNLYVNQPDGLCQSAISETRYWPSTLCLVSPHIDCATLLPMQFYHIGCVHWRGRCSSHQCRFCSLTKIARRSHHPSLPRFPLHPMIYTHLQPRPRSYIAMTCSASRLLVAGAILSEILFLSLFAAFRRANRLLRKASYGSRVYSPDPTSIPASTSYRVFPQLSWKAVLKKSGPEPRT